MKKTFLNVSIRTPLNELFHVAASRTGVVLETPRVAIIEDEYRVREDEYRYHNDIMMRLSHFRNLVCEVRIEATLIPPSVR
jgi:hypothetical protein